MTKVRRLYLRITCILVLLAFIVYVLYCKLESSSNHAQFVETQYYPNGNPSAFGKDAHTYSYHQYLPNSSVIVGKEFNISSTAEEILNTQTFRRKPVNMDSYSSLPRVVPITAISSNHFEEFFLHFKTAIPYFFADVKLVLFDLGLEYRQVEILRNMTFVEYRKFDFARYPPHVTNLLTYAWKVFIIQKMLTEFGAIMWMDASIQLVRNFTPAIEQMVKERSGFLFFINSARHSVFAATHPNMYEYFPVTDFQKVNVSMQQATAMIIFGTPEVQRDVMKWAVLCSLDRNCIAPIGSRKHCPQTIFRRDHNVPSCHRFDQSLFHLLVANAYKCQSEKYTIRSSNMFAKVERLKNIIKAAGQGN